MKEIERKSFEIAPPILFNPLKHHRKYIKFFISSLRSADNASDLLKMNLLKIGSAKIDIYKGSLTLQEISQQITGHLESNNILDFNSYVSRIMADGYLIVTLSDNSDWTLLIGEAPNRYAHIHPARKSLYVERISASSLKTVIAYLTLCDQTEIEESNLKDINDIRKDYCGLPPLKNLSRAKSIVKLIKILT